MGDSIFGSRTERSRAGFGSQPAKSRIRRRVAMYRASGYVAIERYNENPYANHWFAKQLTRTDSDRP